MFDTLLNVQFLLNNSSSTVAGPHLVFHGFETVDPTDLQLKNSLPSCPVQFVEVLQQGNKRHNKLIKIRKEAAASEMQYYFDPSIVTMLIFQPLDFVLIESHNNPRNSISMQKFRVHKHGPYQIHAVHGYHCILKDTDGNILNDLIPIRKLHKIDGYKEYFHVDHETMDISQLFDNSSLDSDVRVSTQHEPEVHADNQDCHPEHNVKAPVADLLEPDACETDNEAPGLIDTTIKLV